MTRPSCTIVRWLSGDHTTDGSSEMLPSRMSRSAVQPSATRPRSGRPISSALTEVAEASAVQIPSTYRLQAQAVELLVLQHAHQVGAEAIYPGGAGKLDEPVPRIPGPPGSCAGRSPAGRSAPPGARSRHRRPGWARERPRPRPSPPPSAHRADCRARCCARRCRSSGGSPRASRRARPRSCRAGPPHRSPRGSPRRSTAGSGSGRPAT